MHTTYLKLSDHIAGVLGDVIVALLDTYLGVNIRHMHILLGIYVFSAVSYSIEGHVHQCAMHDRLHHCMPHMAILRYSTTSMSYSAVVCCTYKHLCVAPIS